MSAAQVIGVDLGGTNVNLCVLNRANEEIAREHFPTESHRGAEDVLDRLAENIRAICSASGTELSNVEAVGVAVASPVDVEHGVALQGTNLGWVNVPVRDMLSTRLGRPVVIDNDVNAAVWGEYHLGAATGKRNVMGVWVGTGVGGGLVLDGNLYHGGFDTAGEIGHLVVRPDEDAGFRKLEEHCSRNGMSALVHRRSERGEPTQLKNAFNQHGVIRSSAWRSAYDAGDTMAREIIDTAAEMLGISMGNCVTLLSLEMVVLGGGMVETLGPPFVERIKAAFYRTVFPKACEACQLATSTLEAYAGLFGAAMLARSRFATA